MKEGEKGHCSRHTPGLEQWTFTKTNVLLDDNGGGGMGIKTFASKFYKGIK